MREILFRGFTPDENGRETITVSGKQIKGEWVQGNYWELRETTYCFQSDYDRHPDNTKHYIVFDRMTDWGLPNRHLQADVIPETVGQFTGLTDKNGKKIFEGDVVRYSERLLAGEEYEHKDPVLYLEGGFTVGVYFLNHWLRDIADGNVQLEGIEVIGNIHDNPELLEVNDGN